MKLAFQERAWDDDPYWQATDANGLIRESARTPFTGTGKPELLRGTLSGWWSRRINQEHRLIHRVEEDRLLIAQCRYHY